MLKQQLEDMRDFCSGDHRPHPNNVARLCNKALDAVAAMDEFCDRVEAGEVRSSRTYLKFCEILGREPRS
jgi:hypothetical protein